MTAAIDGLPNGFCAWVQSIIQPPTSTFGDQVGTPEVAAVPGVSVLAI